MVREFRLIILLCCGFVTVGCASADIYKNAREVARVTEELNIEPSGIGEECYEVMPGQFMEYEFSSSAPVDFNIHYHGLDRVHYPVNKRNISKKQGRIDPSRHSFYTEDQENYCLMFVNNHKTAVKVTYECVVKEK